MLHLRGMFDFFQSAFRVAIASFIVIVTVITAPFHTSKTVAPDTTAVKQNIITSSTPSPSPSYSVLITSTSGIYKVDARREIDYKAELKNISIKPFIANFAFWECNFVDNANNIYKGKFFNDGVRFDKAIFPGESRSLVVNSTTVELASQCSYQKDGSYSCPVYPDNLRVKDCIAYITSDGKQVSNGWGTNPINVEFPLP